MTTTVNVPSGMFGSYSTELSPEQNGTYAPISIQFKMENFPSSREWLPVVSYCVAGKDDIPLSCIKFMKNNDVNYLSAQELFFSSSGAEVEAGERMDNIPLSDTYVTFSFEGNSVTYTVNHKLLFRRDFGKEPKIFKYSCSSVTCQIAMYYNTSAQ